MLGQVDGLALGQPQDCTDLVFDKIFPVEVEGPVGLIPALAPAPFQPRDEKDGRLPGGVLGKQQGDIELLPGDSKGMNFLPQGG